MQWVKIFPIIVNIFDGISNNIMFFLQIENAFGIEFTSYAHYKTDEKQVSFFFINNYWFFIENISWKQITCCFVNVFDNHKLTGGIFYLVIVYIIFILLNEIVKLDYENM